MQLAADDMRFELEVVDYEYPDRTSDDYDSNWLIVEGTVRHPRGNWWFREPILLTYELIRLADWLDAVAVATEPEPWCGFIEPNLSFALSGTGAARTVQVTFTAEARPPWARSDEDVRVEFPVAGSDLRAAAASLRRQLRQFPQRAER
jgi:hypothetical protein